MAFSLNRMQLLGNIGKDPETRFTTSNVAVTSFSIATTNSYKDKSGQWQNDTTWHNIVCFSLSDYLKDNLKKGKKVYLEGRIQNRSYEDKEGVKKYITEVLADNTKIIPLDSDNSFTENQSVSDQMDGNQKDNNELPF